MCIMSYRRHKQHHVRFRGGCLCKVIKNDSSLTIGTRFDYSPRHVVSSAAVIHPVIGGTH